MSYTPYAKEFEPIVRIGEYVALPLGRGTITPGQTGLWQYYVVDYIEQVQPQVLTFQLAAGQTVTNFTVDQVKLSDSEFGQWRMWLLDPLVVELKYPQTTDKFGIKNGITYITVLSFLYGTRMTEFYTYGNKDNLLLNITNPLPTGGVFRIAIAGFKYLVSPVTTKPERVTYIPLYATDYVKSAAGIAS